MPYLLLQNPVGAFHHAGVAARNSSLPQRKQGISRVPYWGLTGLHAKFVAIFNAELFKLIHRTNDLWIVQRISQAAHGDNRVHDRRIDTSQTITHLEAFQHPLLSLLQRNRTQWTNMHRFKPVRHAIKNQKEVAP